MFQKYGKSILAGLYAVALVAVPMFSGDHHIDAAEGVQIAIATCAAAATWLVPLFPSAPWTKTAIGALLAGLNVAAGLIVGGINGDGWISIAAAVLGALGITLAPATSTKTGATSGVSTR